MHVLARQESTLEKELNLTFRKVMHLVDSEIVKAMIHKESFGFNTFASNRIGEIQKQPVRGNGIGFLVSHG